MSAEDLIWHFKVNTVGPFLTTKHFMPLLEKCERGKVINISSDMGSIGADNTTGGNLPYRISKTALNQFTRTAAVDLEGLGKNVKTIAVHPGFLATKMTGFYGEDRMETSVEGLVSILEHFGVLEKGSNLPNGGITATFTTRQFPPGICSKMSVTVVLGSQLGDEGKGKIVDTLLSSGDFKLSARCAGGHNAGHTLVVNGKSFDFHIVPSGLVSPHTKNLIGNGTVVHIPQFFKELKNIQEKGIDSNGRVFISDRAHVLFELHKLVDGLREKALGDLKIGTTGNGIGPCYSDKASRIGIRVSEIMDKAYFDHRLRALAKKYTDEFGELLQYDVEKEIEAFDEYRVSLKPYVVDGVHTICQAQDSKQKILVEAANALCLDVDAGTYPFVTSSNTGLAGVFSGLLGIRPETVTSRIGVVKAYSTRVGAGPSPTEDFGAVGNKLQEIGHEFGTTTGRRRRCGFLDLVLVRHTHAINHYTLLNLNKLDVLDTFPTLKVATAYHCTDPATGAVSTWRDHLPADLKLMEPENCQVEWVEMKGWEKDISKARRWEDLPQEARDYVEFIEKEVGVKVKWIGVGPGREAIIVRD
ncbi:MAG: hypothetical protein Q9227_005603 [Pyrenula ochraceoflavens]